MPPGTGVHEEQPEQIELEKVRPLPSDLACCVTRNHPVSSLGVSEFFRRYFKQRDLPRRDIQQQRADTGVAFEQNPFEGGRIRLTEWFVPAILKDLRADKRASRGRLGAAVAFTRLNKARLELERPPPRAPSQVEFGRLFSAH